MKQVKFVRIKSTPSGYGFGKGMKYMFEDAELTIREHIESGWSFEGYIPIETRATGDIETMSLIFQRDE